MDARAIRLHRHAHHDYALRSRGVPAESWPSARNGGRAEERGIIRFVRFRQLTPLLEG